MLKCDGRLSNQNSMSVTYSRVKDLVMGERTGVINSSHSGTGLMSKGAGLAGTQAPKQRYIEKRVQNKVYTLVKIFLFVHL